MRLFLVLLAAQGLFAPAPGSPIAVDGAPQNVVCGDLNQDRNIDLITANGLNNNVTVLLGDGRGGFRKAPGSPVPVPGGTLEMALADFNGDGRLDLASASHDSFDIAVLLGNGRGGFDPAPGSPFAATAGGKPHTHGLAAVDANGDRRADLLAVNNEENSVAVLLGDGHGRFSRAAGSPFKVGPSPYPLATGDVNSDGRLDIVTPAAFSKDRNVTLLLGDGRGGFTRATSSPFTAAPNPYFAALVDINGDRRPDIITSHNAAELLTVLLGDGRGGFRAMAGSPFSLGARAWQLAAADVNLDGHADVVAAADENIRILLGDARGFSGAPIAFPAGRGVWRFCMADLNGDGRSDIAAASLATKSVTVLLAR